MRKLNFTILFAMLMALGSLLNAQDTVRHLVISEVRVDQWNHAYVELTNMSETETVNLADFTYAIMSDDQPTFTQEDDEVYITPGYDLWDGREMRLYGMLPPGESYVIMSVVDAVNGEQIWPRIVHSLDILEVSDTVVHFWDWGGGDDRYETHPFIPEWEMWGFDSLSANKDVLFHREGDAPALFWHYEDEDTSIIVLIDQALGQMEWDEGGTTGNYISYPEPPKTVAGIESAHLNYTMLRKFSIKEGETNWELAKGSDASTSSWMLIRHNDDLNRMKWETEGNHGDFHLDYSSTVYDIDDANSTITVPWGTEKHDSIRPGLTLGMGMAWWYEENSNFEDSLSTVCQPGDMLTLYSAGTTLEEKTFTIEVAPPAGDMVQAFAKNLITYPDPDDADYKPTDNAYVREKDWTVPAGSNQGPYSAIAVGITKNVPTGDSIFEIPFATPVDSLMGNMIEIAPNATYDFVWVDGVERAEVKFGDKLVITGGDGTTTKEYLLAVEQLEEGDNVDVKSLTWPDRPEDFMEGWKGDTLPGFSSKNTSYSVILPNTVKSVPALVLELEDRNASFTVDRATNLKGGINERTTTFNVKSESDTTTIAITVLFEVFNPEPQLYVADPVFSKFAIREWWSAGGMEILNASDVLVDLSNYMIAKEDEITPAEAITTGWENDSTTWLRRWSKIVPGFKWESYAEWQIEPGYLITDPAIDPFIEPKDVKVFWVLHPSNESRTYREDIDPAYGGRGDYIINNDDWGATGIYYNPWQEPINRESTFAFPLFPRGTDVVSCYYMLKILNDSVTAGTKQANDPADFEVVDVWGAPTAPWVVNGIEWTSPPGETYSVQRKNDKYWGTTVLGDNFGSEEQSHYTLVQDYTGQPQRRTFVQKEFGSHPMLPITGHLSTVSSLVYNLSRGFEAEPAQTLAGASNGETVDGLIANLIKAKDSQTIEVWNGGKKDGTAAIAEGDTVVVTSETGNVTKYVVSTTALDSDNLLTVVTGSTVEVTLDGAAGTVGAFPFGTSLRAVLDELVVPSLAVLNVIDDAGGNVPLQRRGADGEYRDLVASADYSLEVIAENGDVAVYALNPGVLSSDAYVLSDVYDVTEDPRNISGLTQGVVVESFIANLTPVDGATVKVLIKSGQERMIGPLNYDDVLEVTSEDASTVAVYELTFKDELAAYVTSDVFMVDQEGLMIEVPENTTVETLMAGLNPAPQAVVMVLDVDMNEKSTGLIVDTDVVEVTSGDGRNTVTYSVDVIVSVYNSFIDNLKVYPNPANEILFVDNIPTDLDVRISDISGRTRMLSRASDISSGIDLTEFQTGMYFLIISKDGKDLATVKFVKR